TGEIKPPQLVLRVGIAEIGRCIAEHVAGAGEIGRDLRVWYAGQIVMTKCNEGISDEPRLRATGCFIRIAVGDLAEIIERAQIVAWHAIAVGVHPVKLPLRHWLTLLGSVLQRGERAPFTRHRLWRAATRRRAKPRTSPGYFRLPQPLAVP